LVLMALLTALLWWSAGAVGAHEVGRKGTQEELRRAAADLRDADRRKNEFLATLAHELRNPLAPIRNSLEVMKRARGDADLREQACSTMERQLGQMVRLIDDLLDVSRITRNKLDLRRERVELASVIRHAVEACGPLAEGADHQLTVVLPPEPIFLNADPVRLTQVFVNLLGNACKFTERGGRVRLAAERLGIDVVVSIQDTGVGIPPDMLPQVFDMFTQVDRTLERSQGGLGIGLTLVKRLVELHDGTVSAYSEGQGRGSELVVRLPILLEMSMPQQPPGPAADPVPTAARRILVVDDNEDAVMSLGVLLKPWRGRRRSSRT
jgi:signal transduction histidine kinase